MHPVAKRKRGWKGHDGDGQPPRPKGSSYLSRGPYVVRDACQLERFARGAAFFGHHSLSAYTRALHAPHGAHNTIYYIYYYHHKSACVCVSYKYEYANRKYKRNPHGNRTIYFNMRRDTYQKVGQFGYCPKHIRPLFPSFLFRSKCTLRIFFYRSPRLVRRTENITVEKSYSI